MDPITVHDAKPGQPFTVTLASDSPTIFELHAACEILIKMGYGGTNFARADCEAGPCVARKLELYDTSKEMERGELSGPLTFLLC